MAKTRIAIAKPDIVKLFEEHSQRIFDFPTLLDIFEKNRVYWRLASSMSCAEFTKYLVQNTKLNKSVFDFPYRSIIRYTWGDVPFFDLVMSLKPSCYLTHFTAMYFQQLTEQVPKVVNVNFEQRRVQKGQLVQERIDAAFKHPTRLSRNTAEYEGSQIRLLNGMNTGNLGVVQIDGPEGAKLRVTDVERTLIDAAVRPEYSGGPFEVLAAYKKARDKISVNRLAATLKKIDYVYPYHQVVGFYLERAGCYKGHQLDLFRKFEMQFDFYLMHQMSETEYSKEWRLYYLKGFGE